MPTFAHWIEHFWGLCRCHVGLYPWDYTTVKTIQSTMFIGCISGVLRLRWPLSDSVPDDVNRDVWEMSHYGTHQKNIYIVHIDISIRPIITKYIWSVAYFSNTSCKTFPTSRRNDNCMFSTPHKKFSVPLSMHILHRNAVYRHFLHSDGDRGLHFETPGSRMIKKPMNCVTISPIIALHMLIHA